MTPAQHEFLELAYQGAKAAGHIFPDAAACEAAVETGWGTSQLYLRAHNIFGEKVPIHPNPAYGAITLATGEVVGGERVIVQARFVSYPTIAESFADRMATLKRLSYAYPNYECALTATSPEAYLTAVSGSWSTDPNRAAVCTDILHAHQALFETVVTT